MKKPGYALLVFLSITALLGSVVVQSVWIYKGYEDAKTRIAQNLHEALEQAVKEINEAEDIAFIAQVHLDSSSSTKPEIHQVRVIKHSESNTSIAEVKGQDSVVETQTIRMEVTTQGGMMGEEIKTLVWNSDSLIEEVIGLDVDGRLEEVVEKIKKEKLIQKGDWQNRMDSASLVRKLKHAMTENGLAAAPFEFAVVTGDSTPMDGFKSKRFRVDLPLSASLPLFPFDLRRKDIHAMVALPDLWTPIFQEMYILITSSFIFTLLTIVLFIFTLQRLMNQSRLNAIKNDFINNMSHEMKTPLATIGLAADSLGHPATQGHPNQISSLADTIKSEQQRISAHVSRVLDLAITEQNEPTLNLTEVDLFDLANEVVESMKLQAQQVNAEIHLEKTEPLCFVRADREFMRGLISNLLDNALKYGGKNPHVLISVHKEEEQILLDVHDYGIGINEADLQHIFTKFFRAGQGNLHRVKGFGIGLSYAQRVAEMHGGHITAKSSPNKGSTFTLHLPAT